MNGSVRIAIRVRFDRLHFNGQVQGYQNAAKVVEQRTDEGFLWIGKTGPVRDCSPQNGAVERPRQSIDEIGTFGLCLQMLEQNQPRRDCPDALEAKEQNRSRNRRHLVPVRERRRVDEAQKLLSKAVVLQNCIRQDAR